MPAGPKVIPILKKTSGHGIVLAAEQGGLNGVETPNKDGRHWLRDAVLLGLLLVIALAAAYPGTFLRRDIIGPADVLYSIPPWHEHRPDPWIPSPHHLMLDIYAFFSQSYHNVAADFQRGVWPLWNPCQFAGMPVMANYQSSVFYPPRVLLTFFDLPVAMTLFVLVKLLLCGFNAFFCARGLGMPRRAGVFLALAWMLSGYCLIWANWPLTDVAAWFPILFLGVEWILCGRYRRGFLTGVLGASLMLLAGHPETVFTFSFALGIYFLIRMLFIALRGGNLWRPVLACAAMWSVALLVSSVQLVPFLEYMLNSSTFFDRHHKSDMGGFPFRDLGSFFAPRFLGTAYENNYWGCLDSNLDTMLHPGAAVWLLVSWVLFRRRRGASPEPEDAPWGERLIAMFAASAVVLLLAFEVPTLMFFHKLPVLGAIVRAYYAAFPLFAFPLAAAHGLARWTGERRGLRDMAALLPVVALAALCIGGIYQFNAPLLRMTGTSAYITKDAAVTGCFALAAAAILCIQCFRSAPRLIAALLTLCVSANLLYAQWGMNPTSLRRDFFPRTELTDLLQSLGHPCRVGVTEGGIPGGILNVYGIEDWLGYDGIYPARVWRLQHAMGREFWARLEPAASIEYYLHDDRYPPIADPDALARMPLVTKLDQLTVYHNTRALPRARLVGQSEIIADSAKAFFRMKENSFDPAKLVILETAPKTGLPAPVDGDPGTAKVTRYETSRVTIETEAAADAMLVLADAYFPGWHAYLDGTPLEIVPAYFAFRAVAVPKGMHTVEFRYEPASFRLGFALSGITLLAGFLWAMVELLRTFRRSNRHASPSSVA